MSNQIKSEHFTLHQLADGVYAAIATEGGAAFSNAGLIDLGDQTLVFDAFETPQAAEDLLNASLQLTHREPAIVIISHLHPDHWGGLQVFTDSMILATHETRKQMAPIAKEMSKEKQDLSRMEQDLQRIEKQLAAESDAHKRHVLEISIARQRHTLQALPTLQPTLPNQTFDGKIVFHGKRRSAELIATGKGHTLSDSILNLSQDRVVFLGDVGFFQSQPFMPYGFPAEWLALLDRLAEWNIKTFVPGHGPLGRKTDLALEAEYIRALEILVQRVVQRGGTVKDALRSTLPAPFDAWQAVGQRFEANVRTSYKRQRKQMGSSGSV
jgi:cyclase